MIKKGLVTIAFACLFSFCLLGQPCAVPYLNPAANFTEVCSVTGSTTYAIVVTAASDSTLSINGLYMEPTGYVIADIDCNGNSFSFAYQAQAPTYFLTGQGFISGQTVSIAYSVFHASDSTFLEACNGSYGPGSVGLNTQPSSAELFLYPNPASSKVNVAISGADKPTGSWYCELHDLQGRLVTRQTFASSDTQVMELEKIPSGLYLATVGTHLDELAHRVLVVK